MRNYILNTLEDTKAFAEGIAAQIEKGDVLFLRGPLGAGKTAFSRALIQFLAGQDCDVPSPTFTLVQQYETEKLSLWHFDLYRLSTSDDVWELGLEEALAEGAALIEWPERLEFITLSNVLDLEFSHTHEASTVRKVRMRPTGRWVKKLEVLDV